MPIFARVHNTRLRHNIPPIKVRHHYSENSFFLSSLLEWNKPEFNISNSTSLNTFKKKLLSFIWPYANNIFNTYNLLGIKLWTRLHLGLSQFYEHKFRHILKLLCECGKDTESTMHFFLYCTNSLIPRQTIFQKIKNIDDNIFFFCSDILTNTVPDISSYLYWF